MCIRDSFWIGTTNIVGRHVSHGDTTEAFALTYAFTLLQIAIGIIGVMNAEKGRMSTVIFGILAFIPQIAHFFHIKGSIIPVSYTHLQCSVRQLYCHLHDLLLLFPQQPVRPHLQQMYPLLSDHNLHLQ